MDSVETTTTSPLCPACGYSRAGIPHESVCPECGAVGFANAFVLQGSAVRPMMSLRVLLSVFGGLCFALFMASWLGPIFGALIAGLAVVVLHGILSAHGSPQSPDLRVAASWLIHPAGVVVRTGSSVRYLPRARIKRIDCHKSLFGSISQLMIVMHMWSEGPVLATTCVLYIEGPDEDRIARWQRARETLGLLKPEGADATGLVRK